MQQKDGDLEQEENFTWTIELLDPLHIGSGNGSLSDSDIIRDTDNKPYIPGSTLAGAFSSILSNVKDSSKVFGQNGDDESSMLYIYDAKLVTDTYVTGVRDGVSLDENKSTEDYKRYDCEYLERGARFTIRIKAEHRSGWIDPSPVVSHLESFLRDSRGLVTLGGKTTRGYGRIRLVTEESCICAGQERFLPYEIYSRSFTISAPLVVRDYRAPTEKSPFSVMKSGDDFLLPGTSITGAIRSGCRRILKEGGCPEDEIKKYLERMFGSTKRKSDISFLNCYLKQGDFTEHQPTRLRIDSFSAAVLNTFHDSFLYPKNGKAKIVIEYRLDKSLIEIPLITSLLESVFIEIALGLIPFGGLTAQGCGILGPGTDNPAPSGGSR